MLKTSAIFSRGYLSGTKRSLFAAQMAQRNFRAALVFAGNGVYDGTETTEAVSLLIGLSKLGASV